MQSLGALRQEAVETHHVLVAQDPKLVERIRTAFAKKEQ